MRGVLEMISLKKIEVSKIRLYFIPKKK